MAIRINLTNNSKKDHYGEIGEEVWGGFYNVKTLCGLNKRGVPATARLNPMCPKCEKAASRA